MSLLHRLGKKVFFGRFQKPWRWPADVSEGGWERVAFPNAGGARLAAVFGAAHDRPVRGAVVLAHPMGLAAKGFWLKHGHAELLRGSGFHVLAFDFNGFGESESSDFDYPGDVVAAGEYLRRRAPGLPIAVIGSSFGAGYALCAMSRDGHPFRAAVLEAAFPSLPYYWRKYPLPHALLRLSHVIYPAFERRLRPILAAAELKGHPRVLLIHGDADSLSPVAVGAELQNAMSARASAELWVVPGAQHNLALAAQRDEYAQRVTAFLREAGLLGANPAGL
jgi:alpha-beta hydrolase superfamily lysophospholipase